MAPLLQVVYPGPKGRPMRGVIALPRDDGRNRPAVIVIHEIFGLNQDIRRITAHVADLGYVALCPDLFDRPGPRFYCVARTLLDYRRGRGEAWDSLDATRKYLSNRRGVDPARCGVIGFCMGGGFALRYARRTAMNVAGAFYADVPKTAEELHGICPVVAGYGERDRVFASHGPRLKAILEQLHVPNDVEMYERAGHSYMSAYSTWWGRLGSMSPLKVDYDPQAANDSWRRIEAFFHRHLG